MENRFKLRFRSRDALNAAIAIESVETQPVVVNERRVYIAYQAAPGPERMANPLVTIEALNRIAKDFDAKLVVDQRYDLDDDVSPDILVDAPETAEEASLAEVVADIKADAAWGTSRGEGVTIAIVDTGIHGGHPEFPSARRAGGWAVLNDDPWTDWHGHGTMCACIAAANAPHGGRYVGVAPDAKIMACKTHFYDSELAAIYDALTDRATEGERIVASNSFGRRTGSPPAPDPDSDFLPALDDAVAAGVVVVFSAGNNHQLGGGSPSACSPNTVWLHKSRADVLAAATCQLDHTMWYYSSRGPGQHHGDPNTNRKPDVTAPTPKNGRILYGTSERVLANGWGTSGACPQVAGLAALLISANPGIDRIGVYDRIRNACQTLGLAHECQGHGIIDCVAAMAMV